MKKLRSAFNLTIQKMQRNNSARQSAMRFPAWAIILFLLSASFACVAQAVQPKLIDVHEHFRGEPGMLDGLLAKLNAADGIGILLVTPNGFPKPVNLSTSIPTASSASAISSSTIRMFSTKSTVFIRRVFAAWARFPRH
jgi:hypothetical protein